MFRDRIGLYVIRVGLVASLCLSLKAQTISGIITGKVLDPSGAGTSAIITATNGETGKSYTAQAGEDGNYRLIEVPPGDYTVKAESLGLQTLVYQHVRVDVNRTTPQDFQLAVATQAVTVNVKASTAPFTDTSAPTLRTDFNDTDIRQMPILTRDVNNLALLSPGVVDVRTYSFGSTLVPFSTNGSRGRDNNFIIDSVSNNEPLLGGAATQFTNTDVFDEYTVLTNQVKAEFGRNSGATITAITKAGYEHPHGSLFWFGQNQSFNAMTQAEHQALLSSPANTYENVGGFTLGGPLREKLLYFISYQWDGALNDLSSVFPVLNTLPTVDGLTALQGLPSNPALAALLNTPTVTQVPGAASQCFGSVPTLPGAQNGRALNPCFPPFAVPVTTANGAQTVPYGVYLIPNGNVFNQHDHQASGRLDYRISDTDDVFGRYLFDDLRTPRSALNPAGEAAFSSLGLLSYWRDFYHQRTQSLLLNERHQWVKALNELRGSYVRIFQNDGALKAAPSVTDGQASATVADYFGAFGAFSGNFPAAGTAFTLGTDTRPNRTASNIAEVQDNFSYTHGNKSFKFGGDFIRTQTNVLNVPEDLGHYFYSSQFWVAPGAFSNILSTQCAAINGLSQFVNEGNAMCSPGNSDSKKGPVYAPVASNAGWMYQRIPDLLVDNAGKVIGQGPEELPIREFDEFVFGQVDWRVHPNLTLNLGLRYENFGQPINSLGLLNPAAPRVANDNKNFGPRIGFAWSPWDWHNTVFRGGYGIMYDPMVLNIPLAIWQSGPISPLVQYFSNVTLAGDTTSKNAVTPSGTFPAIPFTIADLQNAFLAPGCDVWHGNPWVPVIDCSDQVTADPHLRNPYLQTWSFSIQHSVTPNLLWEVAYVGNRGSKNYQRIDTNPFQGYDTTPDFSGPGTPSCLATPDTPSDACLNDRLNPGRGDIQAFTNGGVSTYNALQLSVTRRTAAKPWGNLALTAGYTLSHMIDNSSEAFSSAAVPILQPSSFLESLLSASDQKLVEVSTPLPQDSTNLAAEKANSSYDHRHRVAVSFIYQFPSASRWKSFLNGWQINGVEQFQTGQPFSALNGSPLGACADANGTGILTNDRPAIGNNDAPAGSVALVDDKTCRSIDAVTQISNGDQISPSSTGYIDLNGNPIDPRTAHFVQVPLGVRAGQPFMAPVYPSGFSSSSSVGQETFIAGSAGRNTLFGPNTQELDLALYKNFAVGEHRSVQFRWEVYDVLNHPNPGYPIGNVFAARAEQTFGYAFSTRSTPAGVTGLTPENSIDAFTLTGGKSVYNFLSTQYMNTSNRRMQFGIHFIF
ncbi:MAG: TonB-dependent receptor [Terriglobia bacterium]|jgi:hypothetical protein